MATATRTIAIRSSTASSRSRRRTSARAASARRAPSVVRDECDGAGVNRTRHTAVLDAPAAWRGLRCVGGLRRRLAGDALSRWARAAKRRVAIVPHDGRRVGCSRFRDVLGHRKIERPLGRPRRTLVSRRLARHRNRVGHRERLLGPRLCNGSGNSSDRLGTRCARLDGSDSCDRRGQRGVTSRRAQARLAQAEPRSFARATRIRARRHLGTDARGVAGTQPERVPSTRSLGRGIMKTIAARTALLCFVALAVPVYTSAQTDMEGVWSGIFTTRHDPYWHIEDWGCFNGCNDEGIAHLKALLADPKNDHVPVFALIGQSWAFMRESMRPHVIGPGVEIFNTIAHAPDPTLNCEPYGFAREVVNALPIEIKREGKNLRINYE